MTEKQFETEKIVAAGRITGCEIDDCGFAPSGYAENNDGFKIWLCANHYKVATRKMHNDHLPVATVSGPLFAGR